MKVADKNYSHLLGEIVAGKRPKATTNIANKDRRQPTLKVSLPDNTALSTNVRMVKVKVEATEVSSDAAHANGSGVRDVRLFRNGSLVKVWRGNVLANGSSSAAMETTVPISAGENKFTAYAFNQDNIKSSDATVAR